MYSFRHFTIKSIHISETKSTKLNKEIRKKRDENVRVIKERLIGFYLCILFLFESIAIDFFLLFILLPAHLT